MSEVRPTVYNSQDFRNILVDSYLQSLTACTRRSFFFFFNFIFFFIYGFVGSSFLCEGFL